MFKIIGTLKKIEEREYKKKNGSQGKSKTLFIEPAGSIYPVKVNVSDMDLKIGKEGEQISLDVKIYPYYWEEKQRKKAFMDVYIPNKK